MAAYNLRGYCSERVMQTGDDLVVLCTRHSHTRSCCSQAMHTSQPHSVLLLPAHLDVLLRQLILHRHLVPIGALSSSVALPLDKECADARLVALQGRSRQGREQEHIRRAGVC
jgi:hypothetical protein